MILANIDTLPPFLATRLSEGSSEQSALPSWIVPVFIFIILAIVYMLHVNSQKKEDEAAAVADDEQELETAVIPTAIDEEIEEAPATVIAVVEEEEVEVEVEEEAVETAVSEVPPTPITPEEPEEIIPDDLRKIEGIGPKIAGILNDDGIFTFAQLAAATVPHLEKVVREDAGIRIAYPGTWPEQSQLAADEQWDELETLQDSLKGGRRV